MYKLKPKKVILSHFFILCCKIEFHTKSDTAFEFRCTSRRLRKWFCFIYLFFVKIGLHTNSDTRINWDVPAEVHTTPVGDISILQGTLLCVQLPQTLGLYHLLEIKINNWKGHENYWISMYRPSNQSWDNTWKLEIPKRFQNEAFLK